MKHNKYRFQVLTILLVALGLFMVYAMSLSDYFYGKLTVQRQAVNQKVQDVVTPSQTESEFLKNILKIVSTGSGDELSKLKIHLENAKSYHQYRQTEPLPDLTLASVPKVQASYDSETNELNGYVFTFKVKNIGNVDAGPFYAGVLTVGNNMYGDILGDVDIPEGLKVGEFKTVTVTSDILQPPFVEGHPIGVYVYSDQDDITHINNFQYFWEIVVDKSGAPLDSLMQFYPWTKVAYFVPYPFVPGSDYYRLSPDGFSYQLVKTRVMPWFIEEKSPGDLRLELWTDNPVSGKKLQSSNVIEDVIPDENRDFVFTFPEPLPSFSKKYSGKPVLFKIFWNGNVRETRKVIVP